MMNQLLYFERLSIVCIFRQLSKVEPIKKIQIKIFKESDGKKKKKEVAAATNQLGTVELDMREISGDWHEAWYTVDNKAKSCEENCTLRVRAVSGRHFTLLSLTWVHFYWA